MQADNTIPMKQKRFQNINKQIARQAATFPCWEQVKHVALLFESDQAEGNVDIQDIILQLRRAGKQVTAWGYAHKETIYTAAGTCFRILGKGSVTCLGKPKKNTLDLWQAQHFDVLIDLTTRPCIPLQYLALYAPASFKASQKTDFVPYLHDFMIDMPCAKSSKEQANTPRTALYKQILHYLQTIQTNDK